MKKFKIYCINLDRSVDRKQNIVKQFNNLTEIDLQFVSAIDGNMLLEEKKENIQNLYNKSNFNKKPKLLNKSEIGCLMSHIVCYNNIIMNNDDLALIIEDDILLTEVFFHNYVNLFNKVKSNDLLIIGGDTGIGYFYNESTWQGLNNFKIRFLERKYLSLKLYLGYPIDVIWGSYAYIIGKNAAQNLIKAHQDGWIFVADRLLTQSPRFGVNLLAVNMPLIYHNYMIESTIRDKHATDTNLSLRYGFIKSVKRILMRNIKKKYLYVNF
jgi:GR25 family glycosyltransferase involved in LPS biosynthesis